MKIGDSHNNALDARQSRIIIVMALVVVALVGLSTYTHFTYRDVKAMVVGNTINLASRADGRIARLLVRENQAFPAGTPLVELANPSLRAELESMEREVDEVRRSLHGELSGVGMDRRVYELETTFSEVKT
jgi:multidrug resistance efflux pump